jgi:hypothetical protein
MSEIVWLFFSIFYIKFLRRPFVYTCTKTVGSNPTEERAKKSKSNTVELNVQKLYKKYLTAAWYPLGICLL